MATDPANSVPPPAPEPPPGPGATRDEWRAWRRLQRHGMFGQRPGGWSGPWAWGDGGWRWFWGAALILIGAYYLLQNLGLLSWLKGDVLWPSLLILLGVVLLIRRARDS
ncbi:MAG: LiaI-LiaF-like domain-containing protein [Candidatus Dormibacteraceae bacterium]